MNLLELPLLAAVRRNHALEHATLNVLSERYLHAVQAASLREGDSDGSPARDGPRLAARSDWNGFTIYGPADTEALADAALIALQRLQAGEGQLAIHPRCGTNVSAGVLLAGVASYAALSGRRKSRLTRALQLGLGLGAALTLAQPLGRKLQEHVTTSLDVGRLRVTGVQRQEIGALVVHRITTRHG